MVARKTPGEYPVCADARPDQPTPVSAAGMTGDVQTGEWNLHTLVR